MPLPPGRLNLLFRYIQVEANEVGRMRRHVPAQERDTFTSIAMLLLLIGLGWLGLKCVQTGWFFVTTMGYMLMFMGWGLPVLVLVVGITLAAFKSSPNLPTVERSPTAARSPTQSVSSIRDSTSPFLVQPQKVLLSPLSSARTKISASVDQHLETLARKRLALVSLDEYGTVQGSAWNKEIQYFADRVVRPELSEDEAIAVATAGMTRIFQELAEDRIAKRTDEIELELSFDKVTTPIEFERWCARLLDSRGWTATVTKGSGDQGADVLAQKDGHSIVLQCKLYTGSVGNKAVQEAFSAQRHYLTSRSAVVTNSEFTKSAHELARTTKVLLLHYSDLNRLDSLIFQD